MKEIYLLLLKHLLKGQSIVQTLSRDGVSQIPFLHSSLALLALVRASSDAALSYCIAKTWKGDKLLQGPPAFLKLESRVEAPSHSLAVTGKEKVINILLLPC